MRKVQFGKLLLFALPIFLAAVTFSCNEKKAVSKTGGYKFTDSTGFGESEIHCYTLSYSDLEAWEKNNLLSQIDHVLFLPDRDEDPSKIKVTAIPFTSANKIVTDGIMTLYNDNSCNGITSYVLLAENYISLAEMGIVKDGKLAKFKAIRLQPFARATDQALSFNYSVDESEAPVAVIINPCPPCQYCIPRCPPDTLDSGDSSLRLSTTDTTKTSR